LSLYSFSSTGMSEDPTSGYRPIPELLNALDLNRFISQRDLKALIGGKNYTYWIADLQNSRFLKEVSGGFQSENRFPTLQNGIKTIMLPTTLSETDWQRIKGNFLDTRNPYLDAILAELNTITADVLNVESNLATTQRGIVSEMLDLTDTDEISEIESGDYKVPDSYGKVKTRKKQAAWSKLVREAYSYQCAVPLCDIDTPDFTIAAHIKKYALEENSTGHRANPYNGLCLCPLCHLLFDKGYFTLSDDLKIIISPKLSTITSSRLKDVITNSNNQQIKQPRKFLPKKEFIEYHRNNVFKR